MSVDEHKIYFITGNAGKVEEAKHAIGPELFAGTTNIPMVEIQSDSHRDIIYEKARSVVKVFEDPTTDQQLPLTQSKTYYINAIIEDTGLEIANMNGFPGPYIRDYYNKLGRPGICSFNGGSAATFVSYSAGVIISNLTGLPGDTYSDIRIFETRVDGVITTSPRGEKGFGFDPIFIPNGCYQTLGEMDLPEKQEYSARMQSIRKASEWLAGKIPIVCNEPPTDY